MEQIRRVGSMMVFAVAAWVTLAGCGDDDGTADTAPPEATVVASANTTGPTTTTPAPSTAPPTTTAAPTTVAPTTAAPTTTSATTATTAAPPVPTPDGTGPGPGATTVITVEVGVDDAASVGERTEEVALGSDVRLELSSAGAEEYHLHGYDITQEAPPGQPVVIAFTADREGTFELESHLTGDVLLTLVVS